MHPYLEGQHRMGSSWTSFPAEIAIVPVALTYIAIPIVTTPTSLFQIGLAYARPLHLGICGGSTADTTAEQQKTKRGSLQWEFRTNPSEETPHMSKSVVCASRVTCEMEGQTVARRRTVTLEDLIDDAIKCPTPTGDTPAAPWWHRDDELDGEMYESLPRSVVLKMSSADVSSVAVLNIGRRFCIDDLVAAWEPHMSYVEMIYRPRANSICFLFFESNVAANHFKVKVHKTKLRENGDRLSVRAAVHRSIDVLLPHLQDRHFSPRYLRLFRKGSYYCPSQAFENISKCRVWWDHEHV